MYFLFFCSLAFLCFSPPSPARSAVNCSHYAHKLVSLLSLVSSHVTCCRALVLRVWSQLLKIDYQETRILKVVSKNIELCSLWRHKVCACLRTGKPSQHIINTKVNSAFHPSGVGKSSASVACLIGITTGRFHLCRVAGTCDTMWQVTISSFVMGFP